MEQAITKNCKNCGHNKDGQCLVSGHSTGHTRCFKLYCDAEFSSWKPKNPLLSHDAKLIIAFLIGIFISNIILIILSIIF